MGWYGFTRNRKEVDSCLIKSNQVISCVLVNHSTSSRELSILPRRCTRYRKSYRSHGSCYDAVEHDHDETTWGIDAATSSVTRTTTVGNAADGGCKNSCWGCSLAAYRGPLLVGGEQDGCTRLWSWVTTNNQGVEPRRLPETSSGEIWR